MVSFCSSILENGTVICNGGIMVQGATNIGQTRLPNLLGHLHDPVSRNIRQKFKFYKLSSFLYSFISAQTISLGIHIIFLEKNKSEMWKLTLLFYKY